MAIQDDVKKWYQSGTIKGALVSIAAVVALIWGKQIDIDNLWGIIEAIVALSGSAYAIYRRIKATKFIK